MLPIGGDSERRTAGLGLTGKFVAEIRKATFHDKPDRDMQFMKLQLIINGKDVRPATLWMKNSRGVGGDYNKIIDLLGILNIRAGEETVPTDREGVETVPTLEGRKIGVILQSNTKFKREPVNGYTKRLEANNIPERIYMPDYSQDQETETYIKMFYCADTNRTYLEIQQDKKPEAVAKFTVTPYPEEHELSPQELDEMAKSLLAKNLKRNNLNFDSKKWVSYVQLAQPSTEFKPAEPNSTTVDEDEDVPF